MDIKIDQEIIDQTTACNNNFACLKGDSDCLGKVASCSDNSGLFVKADANCNKVSCIYCLPFENTFFCSCPTRKEIYKRYKIWLPPS